MTTIKRCAIALSILTLLGRGASAQVDEPIDADRPHVGTGTHIVPLGQVQFELGGQFQRFGPRHEFGSPVLMRVGLNDRLEARLASDGVLLHVSGDSRVADVADVQASVKIRVAGGGAEPWLSVLPAFTFHANDSSVTLLAGTALTERAHVEANYGVGSVGNDGDRFAQHLVTGAITHATTPTLTTYVEGAWWSQQRAGGGAVSFVDYGVIYAVTPRLLVDGGALIGLTDETADNGLFAGVSFLLGTPRRAPARSAATSVFPAARGRD